MRAVSNAVIMPFTTWTTRSQDPLSSPLSAFLGFGSAMKSAILIRSGSFQTPSRLRNGSDNAGSGILSLRRSRSISMSPRSPLPIDVKMVKESTIRRARSDTDLIVSDRPTRVWSPPARVLEENEEAGVVDHKMFGGSAAAAAAITPEEEEAEFSGGGRGRGIKIGGSGGGGDGDQNEKKRIENYYQEMLRSDPSNPLLLRNYGRFLHEVEGDVRGAEECYSRAIVASPKDGDVLSLYGKLVWETYRDGERASGYFERAVEAAPDDCYVLGSYAGFLWDAEEEEEEAVSSSASPPLVQAF